MLKFALSFAAALAISTPVSAQNGNSALVIPTQDLQAQLTRATAITKASGENLKSGSLGRYGNLSLLFAVRTATENAELHAHFDDLMIVEQGSATLVTGGTLVDRQDGANGESKGTSIQNGVSKIVNVGDVVIIPAGMPHQMLIAPGSTVAYILSKIKEP